MAKRYSGDVSMRVTYRDVNDDYKVTMSSGGKRHTEYIFGPAQRSKLIAVDSAQAYDEAAHAALSFSSFGNPEYTDRGFRITRTRPKKR